MHAWPKNLAPALLGSLVLLAPALAAADASDPSSPPPIEMPATTVTTDNAGQDLGGRSHSPFPAGSNGLLEQASALLGKGDPNGAMAVFTTVIARFPDFPDGYQRRGYEEYRLGELERSIHDMDQAIALRPNFGTAYYTRGLCEIAQGDYGKAVDDLSSAITIFNGMGVMRVMRARAEAAIGLQEEAATDLDRAVQNGGTAEAFAGRAALRYQIGDFKAALDDYQTASVRAQPPGTWMRGVANLLARTGDPEGAMVIFSRCLELDPKNPETYLDRGNLQLTQHHPEEARADFSAAIALRPHDLRAHFLLGQALQAAGEGKAAIAEYDSAATADAPNALVLERRGVARLALSDLVGAESDFRQASVLQPSFANAWVDRASLEDHGGDLPAAIDNLSHAIVAVGTPAMPPSIPAEHRKILPTNAYDLPSEIYPDFLRETLAPTKPKLAWLYMLRATEEARLNRMTEAVIDARASVALEPGEANQKLLARLQGTTSP